MATHSHITQRVKWLTKVIFAGLILAIVVYNVVPRRTIEIGIDDDDLWSAIIYPALPVREQDYYAYLDDDVQTLILVDFGKPSCEDRLFVYHGKLDNPVFHCKVLNGRGGNRKFSNQMGSECSSLGWYKVIPQKDKLSNGLDCYRLVGLDSTNSNAWARGLVIHPSLMASMLPIQVPYLNFPLTSSSLGCFAVSYHDFGRLSQLIDNHTYVRAICISDELRAMLKRDGE